MPQDPPEWQWILNESVKYLTTDFGYTDRDITRRLKWVTGVESINWLTEFTGPVAAADFKRWVENCEEQSMENARFRFEEDDNGEWPDTQW